MTVGLVSEEDNAGFNLWDKTVPLTDYDFLQ